MVLGDLGAEVIKLEQPGAGDESRNFGPFKNGFSLYFMSVNRGKKSLTLDLKAPQGKEIFFGTGQAV
jgi:CoA:oxalate CoA-transferase